MTKRVLSVGQCGMDHAAQRRLIEGRFDARLMAADQADEALAALRGGGFDLVLVNRVFDADGDDGLALIGRIAADELTASVPVMLVSNYPEYQRQAVAAGARPGFGKADMASAQTAARLAEILEAVG
jgi:DNA-binding NarL/FixJ family response regulator